jgi:hypothetical protein
MLILLLWLLASPLPTPASAATATLEMAVSTTSVVLGQTIPLRVSARLPDGVSLALDLERSTTDDFAIAKVEDLGVKDSSGTRTQELDLQIMPLALGRLPVRLYWTASGPQGQAQMAGQTLWLDVAPPPGLAQGEPSLVDIKEPRRARPALWPWLLAAALCAAAWWYYRRQKTGAENTVQAAPPDERAAEVIALDELSKLEGSELWASGRFKDFYFRLTEILRQYLERRYNMPATRLTTSELYRQMRQAELDRPLIGLFKELFDRSDLVKFAKIAPEPDWGQKDVGGARSLVEQTTPKEVASPPLPTSAAAAVGGADKRTGP